MSTLSLRKIKHDSSIVDNITLNSDGTTTANRSLIVDTSTNGVPSISLKHANTDADNFIIQAGITGITNGGFSIRDIDAAANRFIIDSAGRVTTPYQIAFAAWSNTSTYSSTPIFDTVSFNVGSAYNSSTGVFTAPIAGIYMFTAWYRFNQTGTTYCQFGLKRNGSTSGWNGAYVNSTLTNSTYSTPMVAISYYLNAGDYVSPWASASGGSPSVSGAESWFSGYLLG